MTKSETKIALLNHGCAKNLVDSELMLGMLADEGIEITLDETKADIVIVNTCSFIHDAEKESVQSILEMINEGKKVIITGCLPQKHGEELRKAIPEAVAMIGTSNINKIVEVVKRIKKGDTEYIEEISANPCYIYPETVKRQQITVGSSSYLKIADGCNYHCGYCIIPQLRGPYNSRTIENIIEEAKELGEKGVSEIVLIAQDTTSYGTDIYGKPSLARLLKELNKIESISWIRIMYTYPSMIDDELIQTVKNSDKIVKYLDMPLQHSNETILKAMRRPVLDYRALIEKIRKEIPEIAIRTAFIVGYPGEDEEEFLDLYRFIEDVRFDKLGVFEYSKEKNTIAYKLPKQVYAKTKKERKNKLLKLQQKISKSINESLIGKEIPCIIEALTQDGKVIARSYRDAPEIDGLVYIDTDRQLIPGDIEVVKITGADEYDLYGDV